MSGTLYALRRVHAAEKVLAGELLHIADKHAAEPEIHHIARDLARWSDTHIRRLAELAGRYDLTLNPDSDPDNGNLEPAGDPAALLEDLAQLYLRAADVSLGWEMLAQLAQATRKPEILALATECHPQTLRQMRWANTMIKTLSPQTLSSL